MIDFEQYVVFVKETALSIGLSIMAVFFVVLFITGSIPVTLLVVFAVLLVDLYLLALIHFWDLTMNNIIVVNLVIGLGLSVDYSAHIAHTYLMVKPPKECTEAKEKRMYKARLAVSSMGSSVIHGGASTFLAIIVLAAAKSYIFVVFFKLWFGIIIFGMSNGFILLPIIFSVVGPVTEDEEMEFELQRRNTRRKSQLGLELTASDKKKLADLETNTVK
jgi:Niemann-Pick C1 protein